MSLRVRVRPRRGGGCDATDLVEANVGGLLTEALTADVQAVLADETGLVGADAAVERDSTLAPPFLTGFLHVLHSSPSTLIPPHLSCHSSTSGCTHHSRLPLP